jgi:hypothetical protein
MTSVQFFANRMRAVVRKGARARLELAALCHVARQELTKGEKAELIRLLRDTRKLISRIDR